MPGMSKAAMMEALKNGAEIEVRSTGTRTEATLNGQPCYRAWSSAALKGEIKKAYEFGFTRKTEVWNLTGEVAKPEPTQPKPRHEHLTAEMPDSDWKRSVIRAGDEDYFVAPGYQNGQPGRYIGKGSAHAYIGQRENIAFVTTKEEAISVLLDLGATHYTAFDVYMSF